MEQPVTTEREDANHPVPSDSVASPSSTTWPLRTHIELEAEPAAVPQARLHARQVLQKWGLAEQQDNVELVVSELVTNAVTASQSLSQPVPVRLWLLANGIRALVLVWDSNPREPIPADGYPDRENGRGLLLVAALCDQWSWYVPEQVGGKVVWATIGKD